MVGTAASAYRPDIQGLRAICILLVLAYHLDADSVPAGFFGVDIFFVVSGYVITNLLMKTLTAGGTLDIAGFYARRAKRLLPNALLVLIATLAVAGLLEPAYRLTELGEDVIAAALYYANFHFAAVDLDYFATDRLPSMVLHYWSLSVEEQFYLVWPLLVGAVAVATGADRRRAVLMMVLAALWALSFAATLIVVQHNQALAFYHTGTRIWELATGALIAVYGPIAPKLALNFRQIAAASGVGLIIGSSFALTGEIRHPGLWTLLPVAGAAMLIASDDGPSAHPTITAGLLSKAPLVWIGDRSYSLYLWHLPVFTVIERHFGNSAYWSAVAVAITLLLAQIAYHYVETPLRRRQLGGIANRWQLCTAAAAIGAVCAVAVAAPMLPTALSDPGSDNWSEKIAAIKAERGGIPYRDGCHLNNEDEQPACAYGAVDAEKTVVLFGDSHAAHLFPAFQKAAQIGGWRLLMWSKSSCPSAEMDIWDPHKKSEYASCERWRRSIFDRLRASRRPLLVVLANANDYDGWVIAADGTTGAAGPQARGEFVRGLREAALTIEAMGHRVAVIRDTPVAAPDFIDCLLAHGNDGSCDTPRNTAIAQPDIEADAVGQLPGISLIDLNDFICNRSRCPIVIDGEIVYRDRNHLSVGFAETLYQPVLQFLSGLDLPESRNPAATGSIPAAEK